MCVVVMMGMATEKSAVERVLFVMWDFQRKGKREEQVLVGAKKLWSRDCENHDSGLTATVERASKRVAGKHQVASMSDKGCGLV